MKINIFKILAFLLLICMCVTVFVACGEEPSQEEPEEQSENEEQGTPEPSEPEPSEPEPSEPEPSGPSDPSEEGGEVNTNPLANRNVSIVSSMYFYENLTYGDRTDDVVTGQYFDLYLPKSYTQLTADTPVYLHVHGGSWCQHAYDKTSTREEIRRIVGKGYIVVSMNYILQEDILSTQDATINPEITFDSMLDDIDEMITYLSTFLPKIGVTPKKIGIGGTSAGGHLSALYANTKGATAAIPIGFELCVVGPTDLKDPTYLALLSNAQYPIAAGFAQLVATLCNTSTEDETQMLEDLEKYSANYFVTTTTCPTILAYGSSQSNFLGIVPTTVLTDSMIPVTIYEDYAKRLEEAGVPYAAKLFEGVAHGNVSWQSDSATWIAEQVDAFKEYLK